MKKSPAQRFNEKLSKVVKVSENKIHEGSDENKWRSKYEGRIEDKVLEHTNKAINNRDVKAMANTLIEIVYKLNTQEGPSSNEKAYEDLKNDLMAVLDDAVEELEQNISDWDY